MITNRWQLSFAKLLTYRAAGDAQRIASMELGFHPEFAAKVLGDTVPEPV
jgi:hypothetical protein